MTLTPAQQEAVAARGNVVVVAGAGTGKTRALVERCLGCLLQERPPVSLDEILVVTFTEAAAAEIRQRIRERLEQERRQNPETLAWAEQLALFESAHIGTLHSFCLQLVRQHFYQLELDPQLAVLSEDEARLLAEETLEDLLQGHYAGQEPANRAVQQLIQKQAGGWDKPVRTLVLRLHHYTQSLPDPAAWLNHQAALFETLEPAAWREWLRQGLTAWRQESMAALETHSPDNQPAAACLRALRRISTDPQPGDFSNLFHEIERARKDCPRNKIKLWLEPLKGFLGEADFLASLQSIPGQEEPLAEDWAWVRPQMTTLLGLAREFSQAFAEAKRELGAVDFQDLEQHSLRLLWDSGSGRPTDIALHWRKKFRFVFVDEYQDINPAQDRILQAVSREGEQANRFLVGDVKQSIYRFRLANPHIFREYAQQWARGAGTAIPLVENFRSREAILAFANSVFGMLMRRELGGLDYDAGAALRFGAPKDRQALSLSGHPEPCVELRLLLKSGQELPEDPEEVAESLAELADLREAEKEARLVALRLQELHSGHHPVWDEAARQFRPVDWKDMAILLRSPAKKAQSYAKEFARLGLPLQVAPGGFYQSCEVSDLLSLLQILDNPLQDLPVLAVLHSPLVGLSANDLARIRLSALKVRFWVALMRWHQTHSRAGESRPNGDQAAASGSDGLPDPDLPRRVRHFLERFARWRRLARQASLSRCLETVLAETQYDSWLLTQPRGRERYLNVQRLLALAQEFDRFQRQGLFRFLQFVEAQKTSELEPEVGASPVENAVRLMSVHQSKGLEFPVVVVADLGKLFNLSDLATEIILDEQYGLCPLIKPPDTGRRYPSLPYWLARRHQRRELLGEELRLLYVAMTRARDTLILSGVINAGSWARQWLRRAPAPAPLPGQARRYTDWLAAWFSQNVPVLAENDRAGCCQLLRWSTHDDSSLRAPEPEPGESLEAHPGALGAPPFPPVEKPAAWQYPFSAATQQPAKTSVSILRRQSSAGSADESARLYIPERHEAASRFQSPDPTGFLLGRDLPKALTAAEIGSAHHQFLQLIDLNQTGTAAELRQQAQRLAREGRLEPEQVAVLDFEALTAFWGSELGRRIHSRRAWVRRELAFTARFSPVELAAILGQPPALSLAEEFVLTQGVVDLAVVAPNEIWVLDFKTDQLAQADPEALAARIKVYQPQLSLYGRALARIYRRPVSESWLYFLGLNRAVPMGEVVRPDGVQDA